MIMSQESDDMGRAYKSISHVHDSHITRKEDLVLYEIMVSHYLLISQRLEGDAMGKNSSSKQAFCVYL